MQQEALPPVLRAEELERLLRDDPRVRVLDVRTAGEFESAHIRGAYNVPLDTLGEHATEIRASVADPVVLVCQSGARARRADEALRSAGMPNLHVLDGGLNGWLAAGRAVERVRPRMSLERQVRIAAGAMVATGAVLALAVNPLFALLPAFVGSGLVFAGLTDTCAMGMMLARLPYNRAASCDVDAMVRALAAGGAPRGAASGPPSTCAAA
jgi:rhodanese-related sulfurtransferase